MTVKIKLLLTLTLLAILPMLVSVSVSTWVADDSANSLLVKQAHQKLVTFRDFKKQAVSDYVARTRKLIANFSQSKIANDLLEELGYAAPKYPEKNNKVSVAESRKKLIEYYKSNPVGPEFSAQAHVDALPDFAAVMQYRYIATNEFGAGEKHKLLYSQDFSIYSDAHRRYQQEAIDYMASNDIYDIYLVNFDGTILYSARKEVDFGTSLKTGLYAESELGKMFSILENPEYKAEAPLNSDFSSYLPSGDKRTMFFGALVGQPTLPLGIVMFQLTSLAIDKVMTNNYDWQKAGLGNTGQAYLVGADGTMRSVHRDLVENPDRYFSTLENQGVDEATVSSIRASGSSVSRHVIDTHPFQLAQQGGSGFELFERFDGTPVLSAFAPLSIPGLDWVVLAEIEQQEANAPAVALSIRILEFSAIAAIIVAIVAVIFGWIFSTRLVSPIEKLAHEINYIESSSDLTFTLSSKPNDVTINIVNSMNKMVRAFHDIISAVAEDSSKLSKAAMNIDQISTRTYSDIQTQSVETNNITESVSGVIESINQVAKDAVEANQAAKTATDSVSSGREMVQSTTRSVGKLEKQVKRASTIIGNLAQSSSDVGNVLGVISSIAAQTNLLALNAAIEAARAGEQGRGFAVVADEVRTLAHRTQKSTDQIRDIVDTLQSSAKEAVEAMENGREQGEKSVNRAARTTDALEDIVRAIDTLAEFNRGIAEASGRQKEASEEVSSRISVIGKIAAETTASAQQTSDATVEINRLASQLNAAVSTFKL
jgi:methyl-accepting chemotaxis protein